MALAPPPFRPDSIVVGDHSSESQYMIIADKHTPAWLRFTLLCTLFLFAAVWLEPHLAPLCRATAVQVGTLLSLAGGMPHVRGDLITLSGFTVRIVTECTPLYACLLYCAFVLAQPSSWQRTLAGLLLGMAVITAANLLRITLVTAVGTVVAPILFDILHVYLGQVAMLILVVAAALFWLRWSSDAPTQLSFLLRAGLIATALFVPWLAINRDYVEVLDNLVALLFSLIYPGYQLLTPRPLAIYNHTFAVPLFVALVLAGRSAWTWRRMIAAIYGISLIAGWHALFRITHVVWTALDVPEIVPLHQAIYLLGQFMLPFLLWLWLDHRDPYDGKARQTLPVLPAALVLLLTLACSSPALALSPVVSVYPNGRDGFIIMANNLNRVSEAEVRIDYRSDDQTPPQVVGVGLGSQAEITVQADNPGTLIIRLKSSKPLSGYVLLATAQIRGTVSFLTAWMRNEKGMTETPGVSIKNPTDEQLSEMMSRRPATTPPVRTVAHPPTQAVSAASATSTPVSMAVIAETVASPVPEYTSNTITFSRRKSVLDGFHALTGEHTPTAMARQFERHDDMFLQEPPVLLSDGVASLRLEVRAGDQSSGRAPQFFISGGNCTALEINDGGAWVIEIVPDEGSLATSVTVLTGEEMIEYPLVVAPPLELFYASGAGEVEEEYVAAANRLALSSD
jgi:exosortase/archaeosortase family protein